MPRAYRLKEKHLAGSCSTWRTFAQASTAPQSLRPAAALAPDFRCSFSRRLKSGLAAVDRNRCWRPGKNGGYPNFASDVSCVPGCRGDSVARHSSFKTWSRLGVGDRLRGSHLDQDQVSLSSQPPVFPGLMSWSRCNESIVIS